MTTREEFEELLYGHTCRACEVRRYEEQGIENEAVSAARNRRDELWFAILAAYDAQAQRIAELEAALRLAREDIDVYERTLDERQANIEKLEAALKALYDVANDIEDRTVDDGDGYTDSMQSRTLERACSKALAALKGQEA